uniref:Uncharacterized protein n=1 Tax=Nelumbo nucifera TaxID=4432 RepID=A0A822Y7Q8_NELNU|nr:TPA_asm: hypothetical protein HUJ06_028817 [Nelumbo nucifera]
MGRILHLGRDTCLWFLKGSRLIRPRLFCASVTKNNGTSSNSSINSNNSSIRDCDAYRELEKLDFMTAAKILFTTPPKKKKFGLDFHLVQLFFACMPSLAVYLVAQYARYEIRRMEALDLNGILEKKNSTCGVCSWKGIMRSQQEFASYMKVVGTQIRFGRIIGTKQELELKKKQEEEEKANELELVAGEEREVPSDPELLKVKVRLDALEEVVKEIAVESKKQSGANLTKDSQEVDKKEQLADIVSRFQNKSEGNTATDDNSSGLKSRESAPILSQQQANGSSAAINSLQGDQKKGGGGAKDEGASKDF